MFRRLSMTEKIAVCSASCALATAGLLLSLKISVAPTYSDFMVGAVAWQALTKLQDLVAPPVFVTVLFLAFWFFSHTVSKLENGVNKAYARELSDQLLWWSIPFVGAVAGLIVGPSLDRSSVFFSAIGLLTVGAVFSFPVRRVGDPSPSSVGMGLFSVFLLSFIPLEILLVLGRASPALVGKIDHSFYTRATYLFVGTGFVLMGFFFVRAADQLARWLPKILFIGQIGLPFLILTLYPAHLLPSQGHVTQYKTTIGFKIVLAGFILWALYDVIRRFVSQHPVSDGNDWGMLISPVALFSLLVAMKMGNTCSPYLPKSDYQFGEHLLGWWSYLHGTIPYLGYMPSHGLIDNDFPGILSVLFYDGTAGSMADVTRISAAVLALFAYLSLYRFSGSLGMAFVSIFLIGGRLSFLFLVPFLCLWFSRALNKNAARWLAVWVLTVPLVILGVPPQGLLLVLASGMLAISKVWQLWSHPEERRWKEFLMAGAILVLAAVAIPLFPMLFRAIRYVLENGPINQVTYGIPWKLSWDAGGKSGLVFEMVRMSWIAIPIASLAVIYSGYRSGQDRDAIVLPALVVLIFSLLLIPYSMGRIDTGSLSRAGRVAIFGWTILIPVVSWHSLKRGRSMALIFLVTIMGATLNYNRLSFSSLVSAVSADIPTGVLKDGKSVGLGNIGMVTADDKQWDRLTRLNATIAKDLSSGETYLDLTNHNAQYFYFNRKPAMVVTAPYNMAPLPQQKRAVADLKRNLPRLALLEANNTNFDGGPLALRDPVLYRFVLNHYIPVLEDGFILGYRKQDDQSHGKQTIPIAIKNRTDSHWINGVNHLDTALLISTPTLLTVLSVGDVIHLSNGERRHIVRISRTKGEIWLDGAALDPSKVGAPHVIEASVDPKMNDEFRLSLEDKAFTTQDLAQIPVAWGRSESSLVKRMTLVKRIDPILPATDGLDFENGVYKVTGKDPQMTFDLSRFALSGDDAGLLRFDFSCLGRKSEPKIQVFWWGDTQTGPAETRSLRFTAENGVLIVPMDAYPRWLALGHILGIRIELAHSKSCGAIRVKNMAFFQRNN